MKQDTLLVLANWIRIYPLDNAIHVLNNRTPKCGCYAEVSLRNAKLIHTASFSKEVLFLHGTHSTSFNLALVSFVTMQVLPGTFIGEIFTTWTAIFLDTTETSASLFIGNLVWNKSKAMIILQSKMPKQTLYVSGTTLAKPPLKYPSSHAPPAVSRLFQFT